MATTTTLRQLPSGAWAYALTNSEAGWTLDQPFSPATGQPMRTKSEARAAADTQLLLVDPTATQALAEQLAAAQYETEAFLTAAEEAEARAIALSARLAAQSTA